MDLLSLQHDIDSITSWIIDYDLTLNIRKYKAMLISRKCHVTSIQQIKSDLTWRDHILQLLENRWVYVVSLL